MKRQLAIIGIFVLLIFTISNISFTYIANAEQADRLEIKVDAGLDGKAKRQHGYPVTLTITNNKEDFTGDLVITIPRDYESIGNKVIPIDIATGTTKTISFSVPAMEGLDVLRQGPNQTVQQFHLYEGSWEKSKELSIDSSLELTPTYIQDNKLVMGVLTDRPDSLNYLKLTSFMGNSPEVLALDGDDLPDETEGLESLDLLVINDFSIAELPEKKQMTIKNWVSEGGSLVTGSEPGLKQQFGSLSDMLPLTITGKETVQEIQGFNTLYQEPLKASNLELFTGETDQTGAILYQEDKTPLVVEKEFGNGLVTQFTYDLGFPTLADWQGNEPLWQSLGSDVGNINPKMNNFNTRVGPGLANSSRAFETLASFKISTLSLLFVVYLLLILPILYIVLKRIDKREWAWIIIPALAIVSSIGLYTVGAKDRIGNLKTNTVSVISVNEQGVGSGDGAISLLSKGSGTYTLSTDSELSPFPAVEQYRGGAQSFSTLPVVDFEGDKANVHFQNVEFWSPRSVSIDYPTGDYGQFQSDLVLANDTITGQIINSFPYDLADVYLISGQTSKAIGELAAGQSKQVSFDVTNQSFFQQPTEQVAYQLFGQQGPMGQRSDQQVKAELLSVAIRTQMENKVDTPILIGFTDESLYPVTVNGDETVEDNLQLFTQPISVQLPEGESVPLSSEINRPELSIIEGQIYHNAIGQGESFFDAGPGSYLLTYALPKSFSEKSFQLEQLGIRIQERIGGTTYSLYNSQTDTYESIEQNHAVYDEDVDSNYLKDNTIQIRVSTSSEGMINAPTVTVEGVTNP
ncbi:hypothetical protein [Aquibacillus saliphilus]|uniref:hypothetical protein n=1 Tax=Aquibacillus saliphilus TaxID=1909422 RepID=UPI001CF01770|nr:hypothetical protein [Aquibacillus saliphilus]